MRAATMLAALCCALAYPLHPQGLGGGDMPRDGSSYQTSRLLPTSPTAHGWVASHPDNGHWGSIGAALASADDPAPGTSPDPLSAPTARWQVEDEGRFPGRLNAPWWWETRPWWLRELPWWLARPHTKHLGPLDTGQPTGVLGGGAAAAVEDDRKSVEAAARAGSSESISKDGKSQLANEDLSQVTNAMQHAGQNSEVQQPTGTKGKTGTGPPGTQSLPPGEAPEDSRRIPMGGDVPPPAIAGVD